MRTTSTAQFDAEAAGDVPPIEQVRENVWALPLAMPSKQLPYMLSYLVRDARGGVHVIDPGWESDANWRLVLDALASIGSSLADVRTLTATHLHLDHVGLTARYRENTAAVVQLSRVEQAGIDARAVAARRGAAANVEATATLAESWGVPAERIPELAAGFNPDGDAVEVRADVLLDDRGTLLGAADPAITVVSTPGHTTGSICLAFAAEKLLFTGDHVLPTIFGGLGLGEVTDANPITDYLDSLEKIAAFDDYEILPGHGFRFTGLADRRRESAEHHERRSLETAAVRRLDPDASVWQVASRLTWSAGWTNLRGATLRSALSQTAWHLKRAAAV